MRNLHIIFAVFVFFISFVLSGCYPDGSKNLLLDEEFTDIDISEIDIKNLTVDLKLPSQYPKEVCEIYPKATEYDRSAFVDIFIKEDDALDDERIEDDLIYKATIDGGTVTARSSDFYWRKGGDSLSLPYMYLSSCCDYYFMSNYYPVVDTAFPLSEAQTRAEALLSAIGLTNYGEPEIYYLNADSVNNGPVGKTEEDSELTRDDEAYIFRYPIMLGDIPVMIFEKYMSDKIWHDPSRVTMAITKDEIVFAQGDLLYSPDSEKGEPASVISPKEAFDIVISNFSDSYIQYPTTLYDCRLAYMNTGEYESKKLVPVWEFDYYIEDDAFGTPLKSLEQIIVDAQTGRIC